MVSEAQDAAVDLERGTELEPQAAHQVSLAQQQEGLAVNLLHQPKTERDIYICYYKWSTSHRAARCGTVVAGRGQCAVTTVRHLTFISGLRLTRLDQEGKYIISTHL